MAKDITVSNNSDDAELYGKKLSAQDATELSDRIRAISVEYAALIYRAFAGQIWVALGLATWEDWCGQYLLTKVSKPTKAGRVPVIKALQEQGLTMREIAPALGVSASNISRALKDAEAEGEGTDDEGDGNGGRTPAPIAEQAEKKIKALEKFLTDHAEEIQASQAALSMLSALRSTLTSAIESAPSTAEITSGEDTQEQEEQETAPTPASAPARKPRAVKATPAPAKASPAPAARKRQPRGSKGAPGSL